MPNHFFHAATCCWLFLMTFDGALPIIAVQELLGTWGIWSSMASRKRSLSCFEEKTTITDIASTAAGHAAHCPRNLAAAWNFGVCTAIEAPIKGLLGAICVAPCAAEGIAIAGGPARDAWGAVGALGTSCPHPKGGRDALFLGTICVAPRAVEGIAIAGGPARDARGAMGALGTSALPPKVDKPGSATLWTDSLSTDALSTDMASELAVSSRGLAMCARRCSSGASETVDSGRALPMSTLLCTSGVVGSAVGEDSGPEPALCTRSPLP